MSMASRRGSTTSLLPSSTSAIRRPSSVAETRSHSRMTSEPSSTGSDAEMRNVRVVLRIRPSDPDDHTVPQRFRTTLLHPTSSSEVRVDVDPAVLAGQALGSISSHGAKRHPTFTFDKVLGEQASQVDLYNATTSDVVEDYMKGHNVTFLAYGQTSSGKSYSMGTTGDSDANAGVDFTARTGLIPRSVQAIFDRAEDIRLASGPGASWECRLCFLELYNEEIIDLLSGSGIGISIREEKDGKIVWSGVREIRVRTLAEVMRYLQEGSLRRQTGETGMNATSSRSHAIFSLTMVQKRRISDQTSGPSPPHAGSQAIGSDLTSPTRLRRPTSMLGMQGRSSTPTTPRATTPSGGRGSIAGPPTAFSNMAARSGLQRPNSIHVHSATPVKEEEMVIVTSKFNMVDLAGSERLKRTAAQGERMREGISINSGLSALGNVISTLSDPIKARGHVPYRDSKLTRMLQDSIGGNAITTMIACVSPIEFNINETLNTIKYASRARNIKNSAKANQVEAGWDDVEHLQTTVVKLRKQLVELSTEGKAKNGDVPSLENQLQSEKLIVRLAELQKEHTELYDRYLLKCSENLRLTSELKEVRPGDSSASFDEMVEPVIIEYEKVLAALNKQLEELHREISILSDMYEEQGRQLVETSDRHAQSETYALELRGRLTRLTERNTASENYIRDLESRLKDHTDKDDSHAELVTALKKEIASHKEANVKLNQHTTELEARLAHAESHSTGLLAQIERHEKDAERRETQHKDLESHIALLDTSKDNKLLLQELQERDTRISDLEAQIDENGLIASREKADLQAAFEAEKQAHAEMEAEIAQLQTSRLSKSGQSSSSSSVASTTAFGVTTPPALPDRDLTPPDSPAEPGSPDELAQLRKALSLMTSKYNSSQAEITGARQEIKDLVSQLSDARLVESEARDRLPSPSPSPRVVSSQSDSSEERVILQTPVSELEGSSVDMLTPRRRHGHRDRGSMPIIPSVGFKKDFRGGRGLGETKRARPLSLSQERSLVRSLSQELSSAQSLHSSFRGSSGVLPPNTLLLSPSPTRSHAQIMQAHLRTSQSLEAELKFVHRIVNERDAELNDKENYIRQLETTLSHAQLIPSRKTSALSLKDKTNTNPSDIPLPPSPQIQPTILHPEVIDEDSGSPPDTPTTVVPVMVSPAHEDASPQVNDLLQEMAVKEASQRQVIDQQFIQIADLQKANNRLREELYGGAEPPLSAASTPAKTRTTKPDNVNEEVATPFVNPDTATPSKEALIKHEEEIQLLSLTHAQTVQQLQANHAAASADLHRSLEDHRAASLASVETLRTEHQASLANQTESNAKALANAKAESAALAEELEKSITTGEEQRRQLKMKGDQALFELSRIRDESQLQRNNDLRQVNELKKANAALEKIKAELEASNSELHKRIGELEQRFSRRPTPVPSASLPPQGPPPTSPLPPVPIPLSPGMPTRSSTSAIQKSKFASGSSMTTNSSSSGHGHPRSDDDSGARGPLTDITNTLSSLPEPVASTVAKVVAERDSAFQQKELLRERYTAGEERRKDVEGKWQEEKQKVDGLGRDLADARKMNSKLRAHLEDARQENKRTEQNCQSHMTELQERRNKMEKLSEESQQGRASLQAANVQLATLKAQLDRAVEQKVQKRLLKCF